MKKKKWIYKNHPEHKDTSKYVPLDEPDGYIINGLFYTEKDAVGNKVERDIFIPIPVYFKPQDIIDIVGNCANCGVEFHIHKTNNNRSRVSH